MESLRGVGVPPVRSHLPSIVPRSEPFCCISQKHSCFWPSCSAQARQSDSTPQSSTKALAQNGSRGFGNVEKQAKGNLRGSREDDGEETAERALDALFQQLAEDLGEDYIDPDGELSEEDMLQLEQELTAALESEQGRGVRGDEVEEEGEEEEEIEGDAEEAGEIFGDADEDELQIENIDVASKVLAALLEAPEGPLKTALSWSIQVQECVVAIAKLLQQMVAQNDDEAEDSELEAEEDEVRVCLKLIDRLLQGLGEDGEGGWSPAVQDAAVEVGLDTDSVETTALVLQALMDQGGGEEEEGEGEDGGGGEQRDSAAGVEEEEVEEEERSVSSGSPPPLPAAVGREVELAEWQVRKLVKALKLGKRHAEIKGLVGETGLDRRDILAFLSNPPPGLQELELKQKEEKPRVPQADAKPPPNEVSSSPWSPDVQRDRAGRKRMRADQLATLERVYATASFPTREVVDSVVELTRLPRRRILEWFSERREEGRGGHGQWTPPSQRPYFKKKGREGE